MSTPDGVAVAHPTDGERDLAALCARLVRRLREVSPDDKLAATATDYLNQRRYLNPLRIKAMGADDAAGVPVAGKDGPPSWRDRYTAAGVAVAHGKGSRPNPSEAQE